MANELSVKAAAGQLGISESAVRALCSAGEIPYRRVGVKRGRIRIDQAAVDEYLDRTVVLSLSQVEPKRSRRPTAGREGYTMLRKFGFEP